MGFRQAAVLGPVCFFLGVLFICFNIDHRVLWGGLTEDTIEDGFQVLHYAMLHGMVGVMLLGLIAKLHTWDDSAMFFDGSSLAATVFGFAVYMTVVVPTLRTVAKPVAEDTRQDRVEAMTLLSAGNSYYHGGQEYARRSDAREQARAGGRGEKELD
ncbi:hypothetical protein B0H11DRAFT_2069701 [Mycena galericulata]|nr:hypothetical protein B0H11DRAFT_2069701 [Mycena galericulata]